MMSLGSLVRTAAALGTTAVLLIGVGACSSGDSSDDTGGAGIATSPTVMGNGGATGGGSGGIGVDREAHYDILKTNAGAQSVTYDGTMIIYSSPDVDADDPILERRCRDLVRKKLETDDQIVIETGTGRVDCDELAAATD